MMKSAYDVIIVGGGPAGASAAWFLRQGGKKVIVLEKEIMPRYKPCGGGLSLEFLGKIFPFDFENVVEQHVDSILYEYDGGVQVKVPCRKGVMAMVMRDKFDAHLLSKSDAEVRTGSCVKDIVETTDGVLVKLADGESFSSPYMIGADGANSIVRRKSGLHEKQDLIGAIEVEVPISNQLQTRFGRSPVFIFDKPRTGYSWIFPKGSFLSVGLGALGRQTDLLRHLVRIMRVHDISIENLPVYGHTIPVFNPRQKLNTRHVLLVGDAAGLADPFSGEGIRPAIRSGQVAAEVILSDSIELYARKIRTSLGAKNIQGLFLRTIFQPLRELCLSLGAPNPFTTDAILELISDQRSSLSVAMRSFITLWTKYLPTEITALLIEITKGKAEKEEYYRKNYPGWNTVE